MKRTIRSTKSRGGCQTCKAKHVKCDETKPSCRLCLASGLTCPGYVKKIRWSNKHEMYSKPSQDPELVSRGNAAPNVRGVGDKTAPRASLTSSEPSESLLVSDVPEYQTFYEPLDESIFQWPTFEDYGYEDLGFSTPLPVPALGTGDLTSWYLGQLHPVAEGRNSRTDDAATSPSSASSSGNPSSAAKLLQTFYRLSVPSEIPGFSDDDLVGHYFSHVCGLYSCFDSDMNPFRSLVLQWSTTSKTIRLGIESMAVAHLANFYPHMVPLGLAKRSQSWLSLQHDLQEIREGRGSKDQVLMSLLMLGPSSCWHQASSLGLQYLLVARGLVQSRLKTTSKDESADDERGDNFFLECLLQWEMLASFVDPVPLSPFAGLKSPNLLTLQRATNDCQIPHAWTGVASGPTFLLAEVGRVLRRQRHLASASGLDQQKRDYFRRQDEQWAGSLEQAILETIIPSSSGVTDYHDAKTPKLDLVRIAQAYKRIALLEVYSEFPELHQKRTFEDDTLADFRLRTERGQSDALTIVALSVLNMLKPIWISSGVCRSLPLVLMSTATQLRFTDAIDRDEIIQARHSVEERLMTLSRKYPQRPILQMVDIVKDVWQRSDGGENRVHWMDVAHERCWLTMFG